MQVYMPSKNINKKRKCVKQNKFTDFKIWDLEL